MKRHITIIPGDGIGPEVSTAARRCVEAAGADIIWEEAIAGEKAVARFKTPLPEETLESVRKNRVALKGPVITPVGTGFRSVNVGLRKALDLFACVRPCKYYEGVRSNYKNVDIVVIRENTEDLYAGIEFDADTEETKKIISQLEKSSGKKITSGSAVSIKPISAGGTERIARFAFEYAIKNRRRKITCVHKANIMKATDGLFLRIAGEVAAEYAGRVEFEDRIVDNMCMQLVQRPEDYDVLLLPNLYGDIISDLCAGLVGGLGVAPGANIGDDFAVFEATHGAAPKYTGLNKVNPTAMILSAVLMLRYIKEDRAADRLERAVADVIKEGRFVTYDMRSKRDDTPTAGTSEMADAIIKRLK